VVLVSDQTDSHPDLEHAQPGDEQTETVPDVDTVAEGGRIQTAVGTVGGKEGVEIPDSTTPEALPTDLSQNDPLFIDLCCFYLYIYTSLKGYLIGVRTSGGDPFAMEHFARTDDRQLDISMNKDDEGTKVKRVRMRRSDPSRRHRAGRWTICRAGVPAWPVDAVAPSASCPVPCIWGAKSANEGRSSVSIYPICSFLMVGLRLAEWISL
jgi:hypothetical protein